MIHTCTRFTYGCVWYCAWYIFTSLTSFYSNKMSVWVCRDSRNSNHIHKMWIFCFYHTGAYLECGFLSPLSSPSTFASSVSIRFSHFIKEFKLHLINGTDRFYSVFSLTFSSTDFCLFSCVCECVCVDAACLHIVNLMVWWKEKRKKKKQAKSNNNSVMNNNINKLNQWQIYFNHSHVHNRQMRMSFSNSASFVCVCDFFFFAHISNSQKHKNFDRHFGLIAEKSKFPNMHRHTW